MSTFCPCAVAFVVCLVLGLPLCGHSVECSDEVVIGGVDENDDYGVSLDVAPDGTAWVVWTGLDPVGLDEEIYYSTNDGSGWTPQTRLHGENASADRFPVVSVGGDGVPWVVWARLQANGNRLWASHWTSAGWTTPEIVRTGVDRWDDYDVCALGNGDVWMAIEAHVADRSGEVLQVYYRGEGGWTGPWTVGLADHSNRDPDFGVAPDGRPWLVWIAWLPDDVVGPVMCSAWADTGWRAPQVVNGDSGNSDYPQLVFDGDTPMVLWAGNLSSTRDIEYSRFENGAWTPAGRVNLPDGRYDGDNNPSCDSCAGGLIAVVWDAWNDYVSLDADIMVSWWEGGHWTDERELSRPGPHKEDLFPSAAVDSDGTLWAAWDCYEEIAPPWDTDIRGVACVQTTPVSFGALRTIANPAGDVRVSWYADGEAAGGPFYIWRSRAGADSASIGSEPPGDAARLNQGDRKSVV
jgi:hypothetical protein